MKIGDILKPEDVILDLRVSDKRHLIDELARRSAGMTGAGPEAIADALNARERLGTTGMGGGIALPHARFLPLTRPRGFFVRLRPSVDFDAIDGLRVDLVFLLLLPAQTHGEHLNALACVARRLRMEGIRAALRKSHEAQVAYAILMDGEEG